MGKMQTAPGDRISDIVDRLRMAINELSRATDTDVIEVVPAVVQAGDTRLAEKASLLLHHRKLRKRFLPADLFQEPGWDMLIAVYVADRKGQPVNVKALVATVDAPATTSQRWIDHLDKLGLVSRATDPMDRRRIEVSLTGAGQAAIESYLTAID